MRLTVTFDEYLRAAAREYLRATLKRTRGNVAHAAKLAGRNRTDLYKLMARYGVAYNDMRPAPRRSRYGNDEWQKLGRVEH